MADEDHADNIALLEYTPAPWESIFHSLEQPDGIDIEQSTCILTKMSHPYSKW